ncbi:MAG: TlpA family protein disulfide reductase [Lysobacteraceae bacterium]|nr:MAG: TlpA family protein disulfide reductase [Xanthomonadaceae bacterium]
MPSNKGILLVALLAAIAGAAASLYFEPTIARRLAGTEPGQRVLGAVLEAKAPKAPAGTKIAERGGIVPNMRLATVGGDGIDIPQAWAGKPTLVNLWASWCAPCLKEMPELQGFSTDQGPNGTQVVGIALDDAASAKAMLDRLEIAYPNLVDTPGPTDAGVRLGNPAGVLPFSVLVSAEGRVLKTKIGPFEDKDAIAAWAGHGAH